VTRSIKPVEEERLSETLFSQKMTQSRGLVVQMAVERETTEI